MEDWKLTLADGIVSYKKAGKKDVKIVTKSNKVGKQVAQAILTGCSSKALSTDFKGITANQNNNWWLIPVVGPLLPGAVETVAGVQALNSGMKEFYVNTGSKQAQAEFIERLGKVLNEVNEYKNSSAVPVSTPQPEGGLSNNTILIIAAVLIVAAIVWALWK